MPRENVTSEKKKHRKYDSMMIEVALEELNRTGLSFIKISQKYNIPKSVLHRHNTYITKKHGGQTALSSAEEDDIVKYINICSSWGYVIGPIDIRLLIKNYLDEKGLNIKKFNDNMPKADFIPKFLKRLRDQINERFYINTKKTKFIVSAEIIHEYFDDLEKYSHAIPPSHIVSYDEINLSTDLSRKQLLVKRTVKHPEDEINHTKGSTSVMMAAAADGRLLPPYVVYSSETMDNKWTQNGPNDCKYNCTPFGWFNQHTFRDWLKTIVLPYFKDKAGPKILLGDNLITHLSFKLIDECQENDIRFIFFPVHSVLLTQPLVVSIFRPLPSAWRDVLVDFINTKGMKQAVVPLDVFPSLLNRLLKTIEDDVPDTILEGFQKCGINPFNRQEVLDRLVKAPKWQGRKSFKEEYDDPVIAMLRNKEDNKRNDKDEAPLIDTDDHVSESNDQEETNLTETGDNVNENNDKEKTHLVDTGYNVNVSNEQNETHLIVMSDNVYENNNQQETHLVDTGIIVYESNNQQETQLVDTGIIVYESNNQENTHLINGGVNVYVSNIQEETHLINTGVNVYENNAQAHLVDTGVNVYESNVQEQTHLINTGLNVYETNVQEETHLTDTGVNVYESNVQEGTHLINTGVNVYESNVQAQTHIIDTGLKVYETNVQEETHLTDTGVNVYENNVQEETHLIDIRVNIYEGSDQEKTNLMNSGINVYVNNVQEETHLIDTAVDVLENNDQEETHLADISYNIYESNDKEKMPSLDKGDNVYEPMAVDDNEELSVSYLNTGVDPSKQVEENVSEWSPTVDNPPELPKTVEKTPELSTTCSLSLFCFRDPVQLACKSRTVSSEKSTDSGVDITDTPFIEEERDREESEPMTICNETSDNIEPNTTWSAIDDIINESTNFVTEMLETQEFPEDAIDLDFLNKSLDGMDFCGMPAMNAVVDNNNIS